jgi:hypothetical protein
MTLALYQGKLQLSDCRALVMWKPTREYEELQRSEEARLEREAQALQDELESIKSKITAMEEELQEAHSETLRQLKELKEELELVYLKKMMGDTVDGAEEKESSGPELTDEEIERMHRYHNEQHNKRMSEQMEEQHVKVSEKVKKLFRKIAAKTHPDKTTDLKLQALFVEAKKAYAQDDYAALQVIWDQVRGKASNLFERMMTRLQELRNIIAQRRLEKARVQMSDPYRMMVDYTSEEKTGGKRSVEMYYSKMLEREIQQTLAAIRALDPTRHQPQKVLTGTHFFVNTSDNTVMGGNSEENPWSDAT